MEDIQIVKSANLFNQITGGSSELDVNKRIFALTGGQFNLLDLFRKVFGYRGIPYGVFKMDTPTNIETANDGSLNFLADPDTDYKSLLGTPIFHPLKIDGWQLPNEPLVSINGKNNIIRTQIAGSDMRGTVKELIGEDDYIIKIEGFAVNMESEEMPQEDIRRLRILKEKKSNITVEGPLFALFNIRKIVVEDVDLPSVAGQNAVQGYTIKCYSDDDYLLELV